MNTCALLLLAAAADWTVLFDGKSLDAWDVHRSSLGRPAVWEVTADGWLHRVPPQKNVRQFGTDLATKESYGDFELEFEWKLPPGGNSGVKYRVQGYLRGPEGVSSPKREQLEVRADFDHARHDWGLWPVGFEYQIYDDTEAKDGAREHTGSLYSLVAARARPAAAPFTVHKSRIVVRGSKVEHWLDGELVVEADLKSRAMERTILENLEKAQQITDPEYRFDREQLFDALLNARMKPSPILLQNHDTEVWFRNIRIRRLDP
jgi:hypothetical protein